MGTVNFFVTFYHLINGKRCPAVQALCVFVTQVSDDAKRTKPLPKREDHGHKKTVATRTGNVYEGSSFGFGKQPRFVGIIAGIAHRATANEF